MWSRPAGLRTRWRAGEVAYSAYVPAGAGWRGMPKTSSPGRNSVTPMPTASTVPERSQPSGTGGASVPARPPVARCQTSVGLTAAAWIRTSTSAGPGAGRSTVVRRSTSGPPKPVWVTACMVGRAPGCPAAGVICVVVTWAVVI